MHPVLALAAMGAGLWAMARGSMAMAPLGIHATLVAGESLLVLPGLVLLVLSRVPLREGLVLHPIPRRTALLSVLAGATLWAASLGLMNTQFAIWLPPPEYLDNFRALHLALRPHSLPEALVSIAAIALMPALCEETLFRGVLLTSLLRAGAVVGLLVSAALFALIHVDAVGTSPAFYRLPFAFVVGLGLGALRLLTGSLLPSMLAHAALNAITFATVFLSGAASQAVDEPQVAFGLVLLVGGGAATTGIFRALRR